MRGPSIEFERVNLSLGNTPILEDVTFKVQAGTIHCIVGANGGGKTSLVRSLLGQMPHSGRIGIVWHEGKVIGYVPQTLDFDRSLPITVLDFMAMASQRRPVFLGISRLKRKEIGDKLEQLGLAGKLRNKLGSLSGGERQRVLLAQALIPEPALLVLDEPTTGLDLAGKEILESTIKAFAKAGGTVVWINHDIVQVTELADAMTYINRKVLLDGAPRAVLANGAAAHLFPTLSLAAEGARA
ncbi:MAG: metal ABC transporter ATP-binding protein [Gammaproteobacteria bacterium]